MNVDRREILRQGVRGYLESQFPDLTEEYDAVFEDVYDTIELRLKQDSEYVSPREEAGLGFEAGLVTGTIISIACWIGIKFLIAATKVTARKNIPQALNTMEHKLIGWNCKPEMVKGVRKKIEEYLMEVFS